MLKSDKSNLVTASRSRERELEKLLSLFSQLRILGVKRIFTGLAMRSTLKLNI